MNFTQLSQHVDDGKLSVEQFKHALSQVSVEAARFNTVAMFGAKYDAGTGNIEITAAQNKINKMMTEGEKILKSHGSQVSIFTTMQQQLGITSQELSQRLAQNKITIEEYGDAIRSVMDYRERLNEFGDIVNIDMNKFWCQLPNGQMVKCQYFVFNPLMLGHVYFPLDLSKRKISK
jgi:hypothetical protein